VLLVIEFLKNYWDTLPVDKYKDFSVMNLYKLEFDVKGSVSV